MGILADYLKVLPAGMENWRGIAESIKNELKQKLGTLSDDEIEEITRRRLICESCPFNSKNAVKDEALGYKTSRLDDHCIQCGCNLHLKTECLLCNCGIEVHNSRNPQNFIDLKWTIYNKDKTN